MQTEKQSFSYNCCNTWDLGGSNPMYLETLFNCTGKVSTPIYIYIYIYKAIDNFFSNNDTLSVFGIVVTVVVIV
jgi:hypothetical protein